MTIGGNFGRFEANIINFGILLNLVEFFSQLNIIRFVFVDFPLKHIASVFSGINIENNSTFYN